MTNFGFLCQELVLKNVKNWEIFFAYLQSFRAITKENPLVIGRKGLIRLNNLYNYIFINFILDHIFNCH